MANTQMTNTQMRACVFALVCACAHGWQAAAPVRARLPRAAVWMEDAPVTWKGAAALSEQCKDPPTVMSAEQIMAILPHRYPFLLVDKVIEFEPGKRCVAQKKVTVNEEFFNGHFPNRPIMPGVLQVEAMAQVGGLVALQPPISNAAGGKGDFFFAGVDRIKWRRPVVPGDTLTMEMELTAFKERFGIVKMAGKAYVDGKIALEGEFTFALVKPKAELIA
ncbi:HotDog domain-containing protein [Pavlovales sp. CCMP2436]|nr:HotDog domain-containing protein [Pavlovales sp. CCMP2436]